MDRTGRRPVQPLDHGDHEPVAGNHRELRQCRSAVTYSDQNVDPVAHANRDAQSFSHRNADADAHGDPHEHIDSDSDQQPDAHRDRNIHEHSDAHGGGDRHA